MTGETSDSSSRHQVFEVARRSADWTIEQLWINYLALGGTLVIFDLDAHLAGLIPMPAGQQDVLACALNERLADLKQTVRVPYLTALPDWPCGPDAATLLGQQPPLPD
nr:hypothetical protein [uncultured Friedmanniella sp.]